MNHFYLFFLISNLLETKMKNIYKYLLYKRKYIVKKKTAFHVRSNKRTVLITTKESNKLLIGPSLEKYTTIILYGYSSPLVNT